MTFSSSAHSAVMVVSACRRRFSPSEVWPFITERPKDPRALGDVFRSLHAAGKIRPCGFRRCPRKARHGGVERVWMAA
jgi:hypothetical protein